MAVMLRVKALSEQGALPQAEAEITRLDPTLLDKNPEVTPSPRAPHTAPRAWNQIRSAGC